MENLQLNTKYKARLPEETIKIIEDFFASKNCYPDLVELKQSEAGTYFCYYELKFYNKTILSSSGKGTTELYAKASGLGELYERYCATPVILHNSINYYNLIQANYKANGYYIDKDEKELSIEDVKAIPIGYKALASVVPDLDDEIVKLFLDVTCGDKIHGSRYTNIDDTDPDKEFYCNGVLATTTMGSTGLAAGNTIEEALIQGISEIYEREVHARFMTEGQKKYYYLNNNTLPDYLKDIVNNLAKVGFDTYIYDLSYNFKLPVCMVMVINKKNHCVYTHFGAFPVIEIAIERCITELYQGTAELIKDKKRKILIPIEDTAGKDILDTMTSGSYTREIIIDNIFFESQQVSSYNDLIFSSGLDYTPNNLLKQINKINKINGFKFYYKDISLCDDIKAVHILSKEGVGNCINLIEKEIGDIARKSSDYYNESPYLAYTIIWGLRAAALRNKEISSKELENFLTKLYEHTHHNDPVIEDDILGGMIEIMAQEYTNPFKCQDRGSNYNGMFAQYLLQSFESLDIDTGSEFGEYVIPWLFYYSYCIKYNHSIEDYNEIIQKLGYQPVNTTKDEFTPVDFINESLVKNIQRLYNSDEYHEFINMFVK